MIHSYARKVVMGSTVVGAVISLSLIISVIVAWSSNGDTLKNVSWAINEVLDNSTDVIITEYYGLQGIYSQYDNISITSSFTKYNYAECNDNFCDGCNHYGTVAFGLYLASGILMTGVVVGTITRMYNDTKLLRVILILSTIVSWTICLLGYGLWDIYCYNEIEAFLVSDSNATLNYFTGFIAAVNAWIFIFFIFILHVITPSPAYHTQGTSNDEDDDEFTQLKS